LETQTDIPLNTLLHEVKPFLARGHSLIIVTPSADAEWPLKLMQLNLAAAVKGVVLLDVATFPHKAPAIARQTDPDISADEPEMPILEASYERVAWLRAMLARMGIPVHLVQHQPDLDARPSTPGGGDWSYIVTPWGKVVVRSAPAQVQP
jgi:hypothetical protein